MDRATAAADYQQRVDALRIALVDLPDTAPVRLHEHLDAIAGRQQDRVAGLRGREVDAVLGDLSTGDWPLAPTIRMRGASTSPSSLPGPGTTEAVGLTDRAWATHATKLLQSTVALFS